MRRLIALLGLVGFTNLSFVQATAFCPLVSGATHRSVAESTHAGGEHAGHAMPDAPTSGGVDHPADGDTPHPNCLMAGPCGLSADVGRVVVASRVAIHGDGVAGGSDLVPPSQTTSPDIPPPKA